jgi:DNA-binding response OmpR family regulator
LAISPRWSYYCGVRILLVEDSERVVSVLTDALQRGGHAVDSTPACAPALDRLSSKSFDLAIVDVGLPDGSGLDLCRTIRKEGHTFPILILTARNDVADRVAGLDSGADDYLGKPFAAAELVARVRALSRRGPRFAEATRAFGTLTMDRERRTATVGEARVPLTPREFDIVALLAWADGRVLRRDELVEAVWGDATEKAAASFDVLLARIRRKLPEGAIRTVRQVGYAWALARSKRA